jgi:hypothetical protein
MPRSLEVHLWVMVRALPEVTGSTHELPVAFEVTRASASDTNRLLPLIQRTKERHPGLIRDCEELSGDEGYDFHRPDESTFRFNRRTSRSRGKLLYIVIEQAVAIDQVPGHQIRGDARKPLNQKM